MWKDKRGKEADNDILIVCCQATITCSTIVCLTQQVAAQCLLQAGAVDTASAVMVLCGVTFPTTSPEEEPITPHFLWMMEQLLKLNDENVPNCSSIQRESLLICLMVLLHQTMVCIWSERYCYLEC